MGATGPPGRLLRLVSLGLLGLGAHNARLVLRLRATSDRHDHQLEHDTTLGTGGPPLRLAVLGDSSATGLGLADPDQAYPRQTARELSRLLRRPVELRALGHRGTRIRHVAAEQVPPLHRLRPEAIAISVGANDALGRRSPRQVRADMHRLLDDVAAAAPGAALSVGITPDLGSAPSLPQPLRRVVGWQCQRVGRAQAEVLDERGVPWTRLPPQPVDHFGPDGFHGGVACHAEAGQLTAQVLSRALAPRPVPAPDTDTADGVESGAGGDVRLPP